MLARLKGHQEAVMVGGMPHLRDGGELEFGPAMRAPAAVAKRALEASSVLAHRNLGRIEATPCRNYKSKALGLRCGENFRANTE